MDLDKLTLGVEVEYAVIDCNGDPARYLTGDFFNFFKSYVDKSNFSPNDCGEITHECLPHIIEINTKEGNLNNVIKNALYIHRFVKDSIFDLGYCISDKQYNIPKDYIKPISTKTDDFNKNIYYNNILNMLNKYDKGYYWGVTGMHIHFSLSTNEETFQLRMSLGNYISSFMKNKFWYREFGMSDERYMLWEELMRIRKKDLNDIIEEFDKPLPEHIDKEYLVNRFFGGKDPFVSGYNIKPIIDHWPLSIKQPKKGIYTVELRTFDSPGRNEDKLIENIIKGYNLVKSIL